MGGKKCEPCVYLLPPVFLPFKFFSYHANTPHHRNRSPAILGHPVGFSWNTNIDVDKAHPINPICRSFDRGTYSNELSGRSQAYAIDRVMILKHEKEPIVDFDASKRTLDSQTVSTRQGSWETRCHTAICTAHRKFYRARV